MESFKSEISKVVEDVMQHLDALQGTQYVDCVDNVRLELTNRLEDMAAMVQNSAEISVNPKSVVKTIWLDGKNYRICHISAQIGGEGCRAFGGVGVAWAEEIPYNISLPVLTNTVNKRTSELWAITAAAKIAITRNYNHIMVSSPNFTYTRRLMKELDEGKLDNSECRILVTRIKEFRNAGLEIRIPDEVDDATIKSGSPKAVEKANKLAKEAFQEGKRGQNNR